MATGVPRQWLRAYHAYGYGCTTPMATGVPRQWLRAYHANGYGRTTPTATVVSRLQLRVCYSVLSQPLVTTAAIAKGKSYD